MLSFLSAVSPSAWLATWSVPADRPSQTAFGAAIALAVVALVPRGPQWLASALDVASGAERRRSKRFLVAASFLAAFLSLGYIAFYLGGGPRAPQAASYWLQGRALSHGHLSWPAPDPIANFRGRYLLFSTARAQLAGIFPPGFALLLAPAFVVGAPMLVGPLTAAALVGATWLLADEIATDAGETAVRTETIVRLAVGLSVVSAGLRYCTADIQPYGAVATAVAAALAFALRGRRLQAARFFAIAGLFVGLLVALQPHAAVPTAIVVVGLAFGSPSHSVAWSCASALPGLIFVLIANRACTGSAWTSPAASYFAFVEPPAALGAADFTRGLLPLLRGNSLDIANVEPLALVALLPVLRRGRSPGVSWAAALVAGQWIARWIARSDAGVPALNAASLVGIVPVEQVLVTMGLARLFPRKLPAAAVATIALALAGFAFHAAHEHAGVAKSGLGRPAFEPDVARESSIAHGLLFFDSDEGYELASIPYETASHGLLAARFRGDDNDRLLYDSLGHPAVRRYSATRSSATVQFWTPPGEGSETFRFEAESDWPPIAQSGGIAEVLESSNRCVSNGHLFSATPFADSTATVTLELPVPNALTPHERRVGRTWNVTPRIFQTGGAGTATLELVAELGGPVLARWSWSETTSEPSCLDLPGQLVDLRAERPRIWLVLRAIGGSASLDKTTLWAR
jgi:hypothetical protein